MTTTKVTGASSPYEWRFQVSLDDKIVGSQYFSLQQDGQTTRLRTEADLDVKFLFMTVYRYSHQNTEIWENGCLTSIDSKTDANRKQYSVSGEQQNGFFAVTSAGELTRLPECVMSFAYWNPDFLQETRLLNSQNGEYVDVSVSDPVPDERTVRGETLPAQRYRLMAKDMELELWYSMDDQWLALESKTKSGRILRYDLM